MISLGNIQAKFLQKSDLDSARFLFSNVNTSDSSELVWACWRKKIGKVFRSDSSLFE